MLKQQDLEQLQSNLASQKTLWTMMLLAPFIYLAIRDKKKTEIVQRAESISKTR